ncbi:MAG: peptidyl-prolyl cis-trans isomerase, partial [Oceanihabitans sp.]
INDDLDEDDMDLMENKIWKTAKQDSAAIQSYYQANKQNYYFNPRVDALVAASAKKKDIKAVASLLKKGKTEGEIKKALNTESEIKVIFTSGLMDANHQALPKNIPFKKGLSKITKHNDGFVIVQIKEVLPKTYQTFEEAKGKVISGFQDQKEKKWLQELQNKYNISINKDVLKAIKAKLN